MNTPASSIPGDFMPKQETFFEEQSGDRTIEVLKSYDQGYAREAFKNMDEDAQRKLWESLKPEETYEPSGLLH
jgi:Mg/Co/Ni transporter MgtE